MSIASKAWMILGLSAVLILVFVIGKANIINCQQVQRSIHGINDDRLVVMGYIVDLASAVYQKEIAAATANHGAYRGFKETLDQEIRTLIEKFQATTLTVEERRIFDSFRGRIEALIQTESQINSAETNLPQELLSKLLETIADIKLDLRALSRIQTDEGQRQLALSVKASSTMEYTGWLSKYTAVIILLIMIGIVFSQQGKRRSSE